MDDGFIVGVPYAAYVDKDRMIEIDLENRIVAALGQDDSTDFIKYSDIYAY
jgi:hypothetical protein